MKKKPTFNIQKTPHRLVACVALKEAFVWVDRYAREIGDKDLRATVGRLRSLLDHEMKTFLELP